MSDSQVPSAPEESAVPPTAISWGRQVVRDHSRGYPCLVYEARRHHMAELLVDARRFADREFIVAGDRRVTYAEHEDLVVSAAERLRSAGVGPLDRVVILGANSVEWVVAYWAVLLAGGVAVAANSWWSGPQIASALASIDPALVLADQRRWEVTAEHSPEANVNDVARHSQYEQWRREDDASDEILPFALALAFA